VSLCGLRFVQDLKAAEKYKIFGRERAIGYVTKYLILVQEISDFCREHHYKRAGRRRVRRAPKTSTAKVQKYVLRERDGPASMKRV